MEILTETYRILKVRPHSLYLVNLTIPTISPSFPSVFHSCWNQPGTGVLLWTLTVLLTTTSPSLLAAVGVHQLNIQASTLRTLTVRHCTLRLMVYLSSRGDTHRQSRGVRRILPRMEPHLQIIIRCIESKTYQKEKPLFLPWILNFIQLPLHVFPAIFSV